MIIPTSPFYVAAIIKEEQDGYRAYWAHRQDDCILFDSNQVRLRQWLDKMHFLILA